MIKNKYNNGYTKKKYKIYNKNNIKNIQEGGSYNISNYDNINFYNKKVYENNLICLIHN